MKKMTARNRQINTLFCQANDHNYPW